MPSIDSTQYDRAGYVVPDLDAAVDFFTNTLGFDLVSQTGPVQASDDQINRVYAMPERAVGRMALVQSGNVMIELLEWKTYGEALNPLRESSVPGCYIGLSVPDVDLAVQSVSDIPRMRVLDKNDDGSVLCFTPFGFQIRFSSSNVVG
jgi:hypothetical protein